jgi:hypothetical protein
MHCYIYIYIAISIKKMKIIYFTVKGAKQEYVESQKAIYPSVYVHTIRLNAACVPGENKTAAFKIN